MSAEIKEKILRGGIVLAEEKGYMCMTRDGIAEAADVTPSLINYNYGTLKGLITAVIQAAIAENNVVIVAQAIIARHQLLRSVDADYKLRTLTAFVRQLKT
jgi:AcrR family transcriptional regulator